ncbi:hypothetical protein ACOME3_004157 [Neoechinorhynchus agilis]
MVPFRCPYFILIISFFSEKLICISSSEHESVTQFSILISDLLDLSAEVIDSVSPQNGNDNEDSHYENGGVVKEMNGSSPLASFLNYKNLAFPYLEDGASAIKDCSLPLKCAASLFRLMRRISKDDIICVLVLNSQNKIHEEFLTSIERLVCGVKGVYYLHATVQDTAGFEKIKEMYFENNGEPYRLLTFKNHALEMKAPRFT